MLRASTQGARRASGGVMTRSASIEQETRARNSGINDVNEVKAWLSANRHLDSDTDDANMDMLKTILLQLSR